MLSISTSHKPATDLGYLLHKNPDRVHRASVTFGGVTAFYPDADENCCTIALTLEIDPVKLVRGSGAGGGSLAQYVSDRPYVASSFLSVGIAEMFGTAMSGRSKEKQELAETEIPLALRLPVIRSRDGEQGMRDLFEPLGYTVEVSRYVLDDQFPEWGESHLYDLKLSGTLQLSQALRHLYVLLPVMDAFKHYYMEQGEVEKLLTKGAGWLESHPRRDWIVRSYLGRRPSLLRLALEQLSNIEPEIQAEEKEVDEAIVSEEIEPKQTPGRRSLHSIRHDRIVELVREMRPRSIVDLGCGDGKLVRKLLPIKGLDRIVGMDVSYFDLERAERRLRLQDATPKLRQRVSFLHGSLTYLDERLQDFDLATIVEVIEHLDPPRLQAFEQVVFKFAKPRSVLITTPNRDYNAVYGLEERLRHSDHRFEWTTSEFEEWCNRTAEQHGYRVRVEGVGEASEEFGFPSLLAVFTS